MKQKRPERHYESPSIETIEFQVENGFGDSVISTVDLNEKEVDW